MNITQAQYEYALRRIDELLPLVCEDNSDYNPNDPNEIELLIVSDVVERYENEHFPITPPTIGEIISDALEDANMTGKELAQKLGVSPSRISDFINDKAEPSLKVMCRMCSFLDIKPVEIVEAMNAHVKQEDAVAEIA